jgi:radical SAM superfamily enzyme YgiQ (UPF0313 family)
VRYDLLFSEWNRNAGKEESEYLDDLVKNHVSGRLKVAPEHSSRGVLSLMRKAPFSLFRKLKARFDAITSGNGLKYELIPYFISSHPGCSEEDMKSLVAEAKELGIRPEQVQDFTPTPMTLATTIYYTGFDPYTGREVYVARSPEEKRRQKDYFFWWKDKPAKGSFRSKPLQEKTKSRKGGGKK